MPDSYDTILYDGLCGLCNRWVQFVLRHDHQNRFRFKALQNTNVVSPLDTIYVVVGNRSPQPPLLRGVPKAGGSPPLQKSAAVFYILKNTRSFWRVLLVFAFLPRVVTDAVYDFVATHRYKIFGKYDSCPLPDPQHQDKFL